MKIKRSILVLTLIALFAFCYQTMNTKYDPLARYLDVTEEQRAIILQYITDPNDIDYLVTQKIRPEQFMDFITIPGFTVRNILYYDMCRKVQPTNDYTFIVNFVNDYRDHFKFATFESLMSSYTYQDLIAFFDNGYEYSKEPVNLVHDPSKFNLILSPKDIVWRYVPKDMVSVDASIMPNASIIEDVSTIQIMPELVEPLKEMMADIEKVHHKTSGDLILTSGFVSFDSQRRLYSNALLQHGQDDLSQYVDLPGRSEQQLGYTITFAIAGNNDVSKLYSTVQVKWLEANAHKYGFIIRYPRGKEKITGKNAQPLTLRYVGEKVAEKVYTSKTTFDEVITKE